MSIIFHYLKRYRRKFFLGCLFLLVTNSLILTIPRLLKYAIEEMEQKISLDLVAKYAIAIVGIATLQAVVRAFSRLQLLGMSREVSFDLRNRVFRHLLALPSAFFDRHPTGDIMSRAVNDMRSVRSLFGPGILNLINTAIVYIGGLYLMARIDLRMTLLALIPYPFLLFAIQKMGRMVHQRTSEVQEQLASISNRVLENLNGVHLVRTFSQEEQEIERFDLLNREYFRRNLRLAMTRGGIISLMGAVGGLGTAVVLWLGGLGVLDGRITLGDFVAFNSYLGILAWPTVAMGWVINVFQRGFAALDRICAILDEPADRDPEGSGEPEAVAGEIELDRVTFRYPGSSRSVLDSVSLRIPAGSFCWIVGGVGSGKTTLAHLIARLYHPTSGEIRIGGRRLEEIPDQDLRDGLGFAPQESFLFSRSLEENIGMGMKFSDPDRVREVGRISRLDPDIDEMPAGWKTMVGERGFTLSGGQRQRAALARTLAPRPQILILDDTLSSLDAETEKILLDRLRRESRGKTLILISHRLTSVIDADQVFVLRDGKLVEEGKGSELLEAGGPFADLFRQQRLGPEPAG